MARFRRSFVPRSGKPIHPVSWCGQDRIDVTASAGQTQSTLCPESDLELFTSPTVVRLRGRLSAGLIAVAGDLGTTVGQSHECYMGIAVTQVGAVLPRISTKDGMEVPWLWMWYGSLSTEIYRAFAWDSDSNTAQNQVTEGTGYLSAHTSIEVDAKAMRRIPRDHSIVLAVDVIDRVGTWDVGVVGFIRALIKE